MAWWGLYGNIELKLAKEKFGAACILWGIQRGIYEFGTINLAIAHK
jgi:hypothetical protein